MASKLSRACNYWMKHIPLCTFMAVSTTVQAGLHLLGVVSVSTYFKGNAFLSLEHPFSVAPRDIFLR